ncbi:MAG: DegT/DnrJ/EryC1/StrS family aminotransferase [Cytophagales bacterium]|nr:DegT/DnrJ/EryC1/StrS family aminotransferase [Cytophagales bacterium]
MVDLISQHEKIRSELDIEISKVINQANFINGEQVKSFAAGLSQFLGVKHVIPCANGTDALQLAIMAFNFPDGSEIIVPSFNYVSAAEAIAVLGFTPVFCDVNQETFTIDPKGVEKLVTHKTVAIIPVHLFGQCAPMDQILAIAHTHKLKVIEDNAQSLGASYTLNGKQHPAGTMGDIGTTSFFPSKNLGCMGDGGAIYTNNDELFQKISSLAGHGQIQKYQYELIGVNSRLDTLQAAILSVKLKYLSQNIADRQSAANRYHELLSNYEFIQTPKSEPLSSHTYNQFTIKVNPSLRAEIIGRLKDKNIPHMIYYPSPLHTQKAYAKFVKPNQSLLVSEKLCQEVLSLPIHPELTVDQQNFIGQTFAEILALA